MSEEIKTTSTEQKPATPTPEDKGGQGGAKLFTQDEVNRIVSERLNREREKLTQPPQEDEREKALKAREARLDCRDYLDSKKYPAELLDVLDCSDVERFKTAADKLAALLPSAAARPEKVPFAVAGATRPGIGSPDLIAAAFKPKT